MTEQDIRNLFYANGYTLSVSGNYGDISIDIVSGKFTIDIPYDFFSVRDIDYSEEYKAYYIQSGNFSFWVYKSGTISLEFDNEDKTKIIFYQPITDKIIFGEGDSCENGTFEYMKIMGVMDIIMKYHQEHW